jgi:hypothetical protein
MTTLEKITLANYRGFKNHNLPLRPNTILVGQNNAGKSSLIEALALVSIVVNRARFFRYTEAPDWLDIPVAYRGVLPSLRGVDFDFRNVCFRYDDPPAIVRAFFSTGERISIYINSVEEQIFAVIFDNNKNPVLSKKKANSLLLPGIYILPPLGPLARQERRLDADYIRSNLSTYLAPISYKMSTLISLSEMRALSLKWDGWGTGCKRGCKWCGFLREQRKMESLYWMSRIFICMPIFREN